MFLLCLDHLFVFLYVVWLGIKLVFEQNKCEIVKFAGLIQARRDFKEGFQN